MCNGRCPVCGHYSCSCSPYRLRQYQDAHRFDHSPNVLQRWAQDDANDRVQCELRDRRRREDEERESEDRARRARVEEERSNELRRAAEERERFVQDQADAETATEEYA